MKILGLNKSSYYYTPRDPKPDETEICAAIDREHLDHPAKGVIQIPHTTTFDRQSNSQIMLNIFRNINPKVV